MKNVLCNENIQLTIIRCSYTNFYLVAVFNKPEIKETYLWKYKNNGIQKN